MELCSRRFSHRFFALLLLVAVGPSVCEVAESGETTTDESSGEPHRELLAREPAEPATNATDWKLFSLVEEYLQDVRSVESRFVQTTSRGGYAEGRMFFERPNKLRVDYDPPHHIVLITRGRAILHYDRKLRQSSYFPLSDTPLGLIMDADVDLASEARIERVSQEGERVWITFRSLKRPDYGRATLIFKSRPFALLGWRIVDAQEVVTDVVFVEPVFNEAIDASWFDARPFLDL